MDEIATGSFKLDACVGPKQAGPFLSLEWRLKKSYTKSRTILICEKNIYQILRQSTTDSREVFFFPLSLNWAGYQAEVKPLTVNATILLRPPYLH